LVTKERFFLPPCFYFYFLRSIVDFRTL